MTSSALVKVSFLRCKSADRENFNSKCKNKDGLQCHSTLLSSPLTLLSRSFHLSTALLSVMSDVNKCKSPCALSVLITLTRLHSLLAVTWDEYVFNVTRSSSAIHPAQAVPCLTGISICGAVTTPPVLRTMASSSLRRICTMPASLAMESLSRNWSTERLRIYSYHRSGRRKTSAGCSSSPSTANHV